MFVPGEKKGRSSTKIKCENQIVGVNRKRSSASTTTINLSKKQQCSFCMKRFRTDFGLRQHHRLVHNNKNTTTAVSSLAPVVDKKERSSLPALKLKSYQKHLSHHNRLVHKIDTLFGGDTRSPVLTKSRNAKHHQCPVCKKAFMSKSNLNRHKLLHGQPQYKCHLCQKPFYHKEYMIKHQTKCHDYYKSLSTMLVNSSPEMASSSSLAVTKELLNTGIISYHNTLFMPRSTPLVLHFQVISFLL